MAIKNTKLGGTDFTEEGLKPVDFNDTLNAIIELTSIGTAQNAYQTLQANNIFQNKDFLFVDEFVTASGTNGTKTGGTGFFNVNKYECNIVSSSAFTQLVLQNTATFADVSNNVTFDSVAGTLSQWSGGHSSGTTFSGTYYATYIDTFDFSGITVGHSIKGNVSNTFGTDNEVTATFVRISISDGTTHHYLTNEVNVYGTGRPSGESYNYEIKYDGTNYLIYKNGSLVFTLGTTFKYIRTETQSGKSGSPNYHSASVSISMTGLFNGGYQDSTVICNTNTKTLAGTENSLVVYADKTTPTNTSMTLDVSDGTITISAQPLNSVINISSLGAGTLSLTFNLATTDTVVTPTLSGYGGFIK